MTDFTKNKIAFAVALLAALLVIFPNITPFEHVVFHAGPIAFTNTSNQAAWSFVLIKGNTSLRLFSIYWVAVALFSLSVLFYGMRMIVDRANRWYESFGNYTFLLGFFVLMASVAVCPIYYIAGLVKSSNLAALLNLVAVAVTIRLGFLFIRYFQLVTLRDREAVFEQIEQEKLHESQSVKNAMGSQSLRAAQVFFELGCLYKDHGSITEAQHMLERASEIYLKRIPDYEITIRCLARLGQTLFQQGLYTKAESTARRCISIAHQTAHSDEVFIASLRVDLAQCLRKLSSLREAESELKAAIAIFKKQSEYSTLELLAQDELSLVNCELGNIDIALTMNNDALHAFICNPHKDWCLFASLLSNRSKIYGDKAQFLQARFCARLALRLMQIILGHDHVSLIDPLANLGVAYYTSGKHQPAKKTFLKTQQLMEKTLGPSHPGMTSVFTSLGIIAFDFGNFREMDALYRRALLIAESAYGPNHILVSNALCNVSVLQREIGDPEEAARSINAALRQAIQAVGSKHRSIGTILMEMGLTYICVGNDGKAKACFEGAIKIFRATLAQTHPDIAMGMVHLANLESSTGHHQEASTCLQSARSMLLSSLGQYNSKFVNLLRVEGFIQGYLSHYAEAESKHQQALSINAKIFGASSIACAIDLFSLGLLWSDTGSTQKAKDALERAVAIWEEEGSHHPLLAFGHSALAPLYIKLQQYELADEHQQAAMSAAIETWGLESLPVARVKQGLAEQHIQLERYNEARALLEPVLSSYELKYGPDDVTVAPICNSLGQCLIQLGELDSAEKLLKRALQTRLKLLGEQHQETASTRILLGDLYRRHTEFAKAETCLDTAKETLIKLFGKEGERLASVDLALANTLRDQKKYAEALNLYTQSISAMAQALTPNHVNVARIYMDRAQLFFLYKEWTKAESDLLKAKSIFAQQNPVIHARPISVIDNKLTTLLAHTAGSIVSSPGEIPAH